MVLYSLHCLHRDGGSYALAGGPEGWPTSDAHDAEAPPNLPGLVSLGSGDDDDVVPDQRLSRLLVTAAVA